MLQLTKITNFAMEPGSSSRPLGEFEHFENNVNSARYLRYEKQNI